MIDMERSVSFGLWTLLEGRWGLSLPQMHVPQLHVIISLEELPFPLTSLVRFVSIKGDFNDRGSVGPITGDPQDQLVARFHIKVPVLGRDYLFPMIVDCHCDWDPADRFSGGVKKSPGDTASLSVASDATACCQKADRHEDRNDESRYAHDVPAFRIELWATC